jgi:hypothetical protein
MLTSVLDAKITTNVVRLGSRTADERIAQYSLHSLEQASGRDAFDRPRKREYAVLKQAEGDMIRMLNKIQLPQLTWKQAEEYLDLTYPQHADSLRSPPSWVAELFRRATEDETEHGEWIEVRAGRSKKTNQDLEISGIYGFWKSGRDLQFIRPPPRPISPSATDPRQALFEELGLSEPIPPVPSGMRPLNILIECVSNVWSMSLSERLCLAESWEQDMRTKAYDSNVDEFRLLKERYTNACKHYGDAQDDVSRLKIGPC